MQLEIKPFEEKYKTQVGELISKIQREEFGLELTLGQQPDLQDIAEFYQRGSGNFWIAVHDDSVVGTIALLDIGHEQAALRKMFVKSEFRGQAGTASKLLMVLLEAAKSSGIQEIFLGTTVKFLAAHRFYEKHGFVEIVKENLPDKFPMMVVDTKFYKIGL